MIRNYYLTITVIDNRIFLTTTPLSILVMMMMMMMSKKVSSILLKIGYVVAQGICIHILVPKILEKKSYGFTSRLKFEIFATKKHINPSKTLVNNLKLLKVGQINVQQQYNDILEALLNCQNRYGFRSRLKFESFVNSRKEPNKYSRKEPNKYSLVT